MTMIYVFKRLIARGKEHFYFVGATLVVAFVHFLYSVYVKTIIEPFEFGIYSSCLLLKTYFSYIQFGSLNAFNRDYPQLVGANDCETAQKYRNITFTYLVFVFFLSSAFFSIVIAIVGNIKEIDHRYVYGLIFCTLITTMDILENFLCSRVRIDYGFKYTSVVILTELIATIVGVYIILRIGYYGLYIVTLSSSAIGIFMYYKKGFSDINVEWDSNFLKFIIISGVPLLINNMIWAVVDSIDKFVILGFLGTESLGIYSIAQMAFSYMILIPSAMSQLFYVKLGKVYGATRSKNELNRVVVKYASISANVISFFTLAAFFFMEPLVELIMPKYIGGVKSAQILMIALAIYAPTMINGGILTILRRDIAMIKNAVYLCILNGICSIGFLKIFGLQIESVALGTAASYLIRTIILLGQLKLEAESNVREMMMASIVPVIIILGPGICIYYTIGNLYMGFLISFMIGISITFIISKKYHALPELR